MNSNTETKQTSDYTPFGPEWHKEIAKMPKTIIIGLYAKKGKEADVLRAENEKLKRFAFVLEENWQAQIAGYYNDDKTDAEREKRQLVIDEYKDLIALFKQIFNPQP